jgi:hypothetical protein
MHSYIQKVKARRKKNVKHVSDDRKTAHESYQRTGRTILYQLMGPTLQTCSRAWTRQMCKLLTPIPDTPA